MSNPFPARAEAALDYPDFHYALLAEILSEGAAQPLPGHFTLSPVAKSQPPADAVGIGEKLGLTFGETDPSELTPEEEILLLHVME